MEIDLVKLRAGATIGKNKLFAEFDRVISLPEGQPKYEGVVELHKKLVAFKGSLYNFVNEASFPQELRDEFHILAISAQLKINALENRYKVEKSFFKPNINAGFTIGPTAVVTGPTTGIATAPTTPPTAVPTISTPGGRGKRRKTRQRKTRQSKTRKSRR